MLEAIDTAGSGLTAYRTFLDTTAFNIANINTARPTNQQAFAGQYVDLQAVGGGSGPGADGVGQGVEVRALRAGNPNGRLVYSPGNPLADTRGYVRMPDIDLSDQIGNLMLAQRAFQANATTVERAKDVYEAAIAIGKSVQGG